MESSKRMFEATSQKSSSQTTTRSPAANCREMAKNKKKKRIWATYLDHGWSIINNVAAVEAASGDWIADLSEVCIGSAFARGAHSQLHHGTYKDREVAVKVIEQPHGDDGESRVLAAKMEREFTREVTLLSRLNHQNVIKLAGGCKKPHAFFVITEYLSGGSLGDLLRNRRPFSVPTAIAVALDIARGMEYVHSRGIIHRDLKPANVIFDQDFRIKVADFGISCKQGRWGAGASRELAGTYRWMAPEVIKRELYGRKVDVYSFGIMLWEMVTGALPYEGMTGRQAAYAVMDKNVRPVIPSSCPEPLQVLIERCWRTVPAERPEFKEIVVILEQFQSAIIRDGNLDGCQNVIDQLRCRKHGLLNNLLQKLKHCSTKISMHEDVRRAWNCFSAKVILFVS